jgi:hypothetical protein
MLNKSKFVQIVVMIKTSSSWDSTIIIKINQGIGVIVDARSRFHHLQRKEKKMLSTKIRFLAWVTMEGLTKASMDATIKALMDATIKPPMDTTTKALVDVMTKLQVGTTTMALMEIATKA